MRLPKASQVAPVGKNLLPMQVPFLPFQMVLMGQSRVEDS